MYTEQPPSIAERAFTYVRINWNSSEGWVSLFVFLALVITLVRAVISAEWVPEITLLPITATLSFLLTYLLAKRSLSAAKTMLLSLGYGLTTILILLAKLWPTWAIATAGWDAYSLEARTNFSIFSDQARGWTQAMTSNGNTTETVPFTFTMMLLTWLLVGHLTWATFRNRQPLPALLMGGISLALNDYFGVVDDWWLLLYIVFSILLLALIRHAALVDYWEKSGIDYAPDIWNDVMLVVGIGIVILGLFTAAFAQLARANWLSRQFAQSALVVQFEDVLARAFGGVNAAGDGFGTGGAAGVGGGGILPRAYLVGNAPELSRMVMMTARTQFLSGPPTTAAHWRGISYDVYTGRGWALSSTSSELVSAETPIALPPINNTATVSQTVTWLADDRLTRYSLGLPLQFSAETTTHWRGSNDLAYTWGKQRQYALTSQLSSATRNQLVSLAAENVPLTIQARYTQLPESVPQRVHDLAQTITAEHETAYEKARAIEQFLRQYPYSLDVERPPRNQDIADFFLFDLQAGYCDYYATSMVVLARSVGLPARLAVGYTAAEPNELGYQTIRQINGHSWAEVHFGEYGWIEFEPTAGFTPIDVGNEPLTDTAVIDSAETQALPAPIPNNRNWVGWMAAMVTMIALAIGGLLWVRGWRMYDSAELNGRYAFMIDSAIKGEAPLSAAQTPSEAQQTLDRHFEQMRRHPWVSKSKRLQQRLSAVEAGSQELTDAFIQQQYARDTCDDGQTIEPLPPTKTKWPRMQQTLRLLSHFRSN